MREAAMMGEVVNRAFESPEDIEIRRLCGERHGRRGKCSFAIESGAGENCAGQEMGDGFQENFVTQEMTFRPKWKSGSLEPR